MNESIIIQKMISIGQHLERKEIFYSGAEADARALLEEIKKSLTSTDVGCNEVEYCVCGGHSEWQVSGKCPTCLKKV